MSENRRSAMAAIEEAIEKADQEEAGPGAMTVNELAEAKGDGQADLEDAIEEADAPTTKEQIEQERLKQEKIRTMLAEKKLAGTISAEEQAELDKLNAEQPSPVDVERIKSSLSNGWRDVNGALERLSTPGTLLLPIGILLILYFLIIPVNGQPRIAWLWLVIAGNATLGGAGGSGNFGGTPPTGGPGGTPPTGGTPPPGGVFAGTTPQQPGAALGTLNATASYSIVGDEEF